MHESSLENMRKIVARYGPVRGTVVDIGSYDVNGSYRPIFTGCHYIGVDMAAGPSVDVLTSDPYRYPLPSGSADFVISGQAFEHAEFFWLTWLEMCRIPKPEGLIFLIAPSRGPEHRYLVDCWRFYPDGFRALAAWGGVELLSVSTDWEPSAEADSAQWGDTVGVFRVPRSGLLGKLRRWALQNSIRFTMPPKRFPAPPPPPS